MEQPPRGRPKPKLNQDKNLAPASKELAFHCKINQNYGIKWYYRKSTIVILIMKYLNFITLDPLFIFPSVYSNLTFTKT